MLLKASKAKDEYRILNVSYIWGERIDYSK